MVIDTPSILFFPRPRLHRLHGPQQEGAELVCATIEFGAGMLNPLIASLPELLVIPLDALPELAPTLQLLFSEAFAKLPGRQTAIDRLFEYLFVLLISNECTPGRQRSFDGTQRFALGQGNRGHA
jgi:hypothetical protein